MAGEIQASFSSGRTVYALIRSATGTIWNGSAFESYVTANLSTYTVSMTEQGTASGFYTGTFPTAISAGIYSVVVKQQIGGAAAESDPTIAAGDLHWSGTVVLPRSDLATSGQVGQFLPIRMYRGAMVQNFPFKLVSSADHVTNFTSGVVSGQISRDGAAFGALQSGTVTETGLGWYRVHLTSGDLLANTIALTFSANGVSGGAADQRDFAMVLQRVSGVS